MATIYYTGSSLDGFIATPEHSLDWLTSRDIASDADMGFDTFKPRVGTSAMGASTWQWLLDHEPEFVQDSPTWVFTHRDFAPAEQVRFTSAAVSQVHARMREAAGDKDIWIIGRGRPCRTGPRRRAARRGVDPTRTGHSRRWRSCLASARRAEARGGGAQPRLHVRALLRRALTSVRESVIQVVRS